MNVNDETTKKWKELSIPQMIKRGDEPFLIQMAIKAGADIHEDNDRALRETISRKEDFKEILELLKNADMQFDTERAAECTLVALEQRDLLGYVEFLVNNGVDVHWKNDWIIKKAIEMARNRSDSCEEEMCNYYYGILKLILNSSDKIQCYY